MVRLATLMAAAVLGILMLPALAMAQTEGEMFFRIGSQYWGAGLTAIGAGYGIGRLAASAVEAMARQPEIAGSIQTAMIIGAALIEGFTFFALFICFRAPV